MFFKSLKNAGKGYQCALPVHHTKGKCSLPYIWCCNLHWLQGMRFFFHTAKGRSYCKCTKIEVMEFCFEDRNILVHSVSGPYTGIFQQILISTWCHNTTVQITNHFTHPELQDITGENNNSTSTTRLNIAQFFEPYLLVSLRMTFGAHWVLKLHTHILISILMLNEGVWT